MFHPGASKIALLMWVTILTVSKGSALIAFDCKSKSVNITSISLVTTPSCETSQKNLTYESVTLAVTQATEHYELPFIRCHVEARNIMGRCGRSIDTFHNAGLFSEIVRVTREDCTNMHDRKTFGIVKERGLSDIQLNPNGQTRYSYVRRGSVTSDGSCTPGANLVRNGREYDRSLINTELVLTISTGTAIVSVEDKLLKLPNGNNCQLHEENCFDADYGDVFWKVPFPSCDDASSEKSLVYEGPGTLVKDTAGSTAVSYIHVHYGGR